MNEHDLVPLPAGLSAGRADSRCTGPVRQLRRDFCSVSL